MGRPEPDTGPPTKVSGIDLSFPTHIDAPPSRFSHPIEKFFAIKPARPRLGIGTGTTSASMSCPFLTIPTPEGLEMKAILKRLWSDDRGANAVEYGLIAAIIAVGLILAFTVFRNELFALF